MHQSPIWRSSHLCLNQPIEKEEDIQIFNYISILQRRLKHNQCLIDIPFISNDEMLHLVFYALEKVSKTKEDLLLISHYFSSIKQLRTLINHKKAIMDPLNLLSQLARKISLEYYNTNYILCRYGDFGDKFYLILKGSVSVIYKKEYIVYMTYDEYITHLNYLISIDEICLVESIINLNKKEILDIEVYKLIEKYKRRKEEKRVYISPEEYINRSIPEILLAHPNQEEEKEQLKVDDEVARHKIKLIVYSFICNLESGQTFGDIALRSGRQLRTATIIGNESCILGVMTKKTYDKLIKDAQDKLRNTNISSVLTTEIFDGINTQSLINKYFNCFREFRLNQGVMLFNQGESRNEIFFLKEGEIEITTQLSFKELTDLIKDKKGLISVKKEREIFENLYMRDFDQFMSRRKTYKILCIKEYEMIGYDEYMHKGQYYCNAISNSHNCILLALHYSVFIEMKKKFELINRNIPLYLKRRDKVISERLIKLRNIEMEINIKPYVIKIDKTDWKLGNSSSDNKKNVIINSTNNIKFNQFTNRIMRNSTIKGIVNKKNTNNKLIIKRIIIKKIISSVIKKTANEISNKFDNSILSRNKGIRKDNIALSNFCWQKNNNSSSDYQLNAYEEHLNGKRMKSKNGRFNNTNITSSIHQKMKKTYSMKFYRKLCIKDQWNGGDALSLSSSAILKNQSLIKNSVINRILNMSSNLHSHKYQSQSHSQCEYLNKETSINLNTIDFLAMDKLYEAYDLNTTRFHSLFNSFPIKKIFIKSKKLPIVKRLSMR